jgi:hypothetical protein
MQLAKLQGLPKLYLQFNPKTADAVMEDLAGFISALSGVGQVVIQGLSSEHVAEFVATQLEVEQAGLPCPKGLTALENVTS